MCMDMEHGIRVAKKSMKFGKLISLPDERIKNLYIAALFHDIGKAKVDYEILNKPGKLTNTEMEEIKMHPLYSYYEILNAGFTKEIANIALCHHENYNGTGYPKGLSGTSIPLESRILRIIDVFDALTSDRVYRKKLTRIKALEIMKTETQNYDPFLYSVFSTQYDPKIYGVLYVNEIRQRKELRYDVI